MNTKHLSIIGIMLFVAALVYFAFGKSGQLTNVDSDSTYGSGSTQSQQGRSDNIIDTNGQHAENTINSISGAEQDSDLAYTDSSVDSPAQAVISDQIEVEFARLSLPQGLSSKTAERFMTSREFDKLFEFAREIERNSDSHEIEAKYQDIFKESEQLNQNDVYLEDFTCNNRVCFAKLGYHNRDDIELFMNDVFFSEGRGAVGVIARAVSIDGVKQMRIIFDYTNGSLILD
ncbi:hypothetical protein A28LD_0570 [Idiomarina sp. A28L]|uniref:hypothetical protein n=1 Tax=Idiomarina sp. A28L TaxID=1036674 RepID=UPI0002138D9C|nr:hypothetical protein [Idiomarina sp. A28L]EGN76082.1 hypothetical protein A28LD_0570 [Idiomarina sp. A28L]